MACVKLLHVDEPRVLRNLQSSGLASVAAAGPAGWLLHRDDRAAGSDSAADLPADVTADELAEAPQHGSRLHLQHGPIDLIIDAIGSAEEADQAYRQAGNAFVSVLNTLAAQLPRLRQQLEHTSDISMFHGDVARRMFIAARPCSQYRVTPMIAVAGAVADHVLTAMIEGRTLERAQVNNGGDIALHLSAGARCRIGICPSPASTSHPDVITVDARDQLGGIATSGWQGRSHSLGIADAVTVLAPDAASADVAATLIANATDLPFSNKVQRVPARSLTPDSDLGDRMVTVAVDTLSEHERAQALQAGVEFAAELLQRGLIVNAYINLQGQKAVVDERVARVQRVCNTRSGHINPVTMSSGT